MVEVNIDSRGTGLGLELAENSPEARIIDILDIEEDILFVVLFVHKICEQGALLFQQCAGGRVFVQFGWDVEFQVAL